jgi:hypothetical protein
MEREMLTDMEHLDVLHHFVGIRAVQIFAL